MSLGHGASIVRDGLVLHLDAANVKSYPGTGTTWTDLSGNGNDGTLTNGPTFDSANKGSIVFDGVNDTCNINTSVGNFGTSDFTIGFWYNKSVVDSNKCFMAKSNGGNPITDYGWLFNNPSGTTEFGFACASVTGSWGIDGSYTIKTTGADLVGTGWGYIVVVADRSSTDVSFYKNAEELSTTSYVGGNGKFNLVGTLSNNLTTKIGAESDNLYINTKMSMVQFYNRALTADEIKQNFEAFRGRYGI